MITTIDYIRRFDNLKGTNNMSETTAHGNFVNTLPENGYFLYSKYSVQCTK